MNKILKQGFFRSKNTVKIARNLLSKFLMRRLNGKTRAYLITEVEAYDGSKDKASHAHRGKTERNKIMFGEAGHWYVYFTYGMHYMLNIVTGPKDYPAAILIRGIEADMRGSKRRYTLKNLNGPARLTKSLKIDKKINGLPATKKSGLWIENLETKIGNPPSRPISLKLRRTSKASADDFNLSQRIKIKKGPRIGVDYAGPVWSKKLYRFYLA